MEVYGRPRREGEPKLLEVAVKRLVPLLPLAPVRAEDELDASINELFGDGDGVGQDGTGHGGSVAAGSRRKRKKVALPVNAGEPSHPTKRLRNDFGDSS